MTHKDAPAETTIQRETREWWTVRLGAGAVGWGRDKHGKFLAEFARNAEAAWTAARAVEAIEDAARLATLLEELALYIPGHDTELHARALDAAARLASPGAIQA